MTSADPGRPTRDEPVPVVSVPEIRDYTRINAELVRLLDAGHRRVRLIGAEGHRLLAFGLKGSWPARIEVEGHAGPELAAELDAPRLVVSLSGSAADGAGRGLKAGRLVIRGGAGPVAGYAQEGGSILIFGDAGPRAGLDQRGGWLVVGGSVDRLAGERQEGGRLVVAGAVGPHSGTGRRGGRLVLLAVAGPDDLDAIREEAFGPDWPDALPIPPRIL